MRRNPRPLVGAKARRPQAVSRATAQTRPPIVRGNPGKPWAATGAKKIAQKMKKGQDVTPREECSGGRNEETAAAIVSRAKEMAEQEEGLMGNGARRRATGAAPKKEGVAFSATGALRTMREDIGMKSFAQLEARQLLGVNRLKRLAFRRETIAATRSCALGDRYRSEAIGHVRKSSPLPGLGAEEADQDAVPREPDREADVRLSRRRYAARLRVKDWGAAADALRTQRQGERQGIRGTAAN